MHTHEFTSLNKAGMIEIGID